MKLNSNESDLVGKWVLLDGKMQADSTCKRIEWLTTQHLRKVATSKQWGDWETLFQDPDDGRYWERTFPESEMQGGGPPRLSVMSLDVAKAKYQIK